MTVLGGEQTRPNIHIDDLVDLYLFAFERRAGRACYNAGFENLRSATIAERMPREVPARDRDHAVQRPAVVLRSAPTSCSPPGFSPDTIRAARPSMRWSRHTATAACSDEPVCYNVQLDEAASLRLRRRTVVRLILPLVGVCFFFAVAGSPSAYFRPRAAAAVLSPVCDPAAAGGAGRRVYVRLWPLLRLDDAIGLVACLLLQSSSA